MNYATQNHIGDNQPTRTEKTTATAPTVGRFRRVDAKTKRCQRNTERPTEIRTDSNATNGILKCTFLPKLKEQKTVQACQKMERDFYQSLSKLAEHFSIEPMQSKDYVIPYNIALAMWDLETKLKQSVTNWDSLHLVQDSTGSFLTSKELYDTGTTLYYIPVIPLFKMLNDRKRKRNAQLLISVCTYLYHIADIPYYRQEETYLYWLYEMMNDWVEYDDKTEENENYKRELIQAKSIGDRIEQKLFNRTNLKVFKQRLNTFIIKNSFDLECYNIANRAFRLFSDYPNRSIFQNGPLFLGNPNDDYDNETIGMEKYISFVADTKGWLYESLTDCINNEFNEYGAIEEPTICKHLNEKDIATDNLDFESRLFDLISDLGGLLYEFKTTEK